LKIEDDFLLCLTAKEKKLMSDRITEEPHHGDKNATSEWLKLGLLTAVASIAAVLAGQGVAILIWPEIALFKPLDSYSRSAIFTLVPAVGATAVLAWLANRRANPIPAFLKFSAVVLVVSIIPDYLLPVSQKTIFASSVTAFLHMVAAVIIVSVLMVGYQQQLDQT
jgi:hypothetical protein